MELLVILTAIIVFGGILYTVYDAVTHKKTEQQH
jgi:hypothetical protein